MDHRGSPTSATETLSGWLVVDKGLRYLATDRGWLELFDSDGQSYRPGVPSGSPIRLSGVREGSSGFTVTAMVSSGAPTPGRPPFVVSPPDGVFAAAAARRAVDEYLHAQGIPQISLPTLWSLSREYGEEELTASHSALTVDLKLLQSPEFLMYATLAAGVDRFYTWGRCYRYDAGEPAGRYLMEFEQVDIGCAHMSLDQMRELSEGVVRAVATSMGVPLTSAPFPLLPAMQTENAPDSMTMLMLPQMPERARGVLRRRLETAGATLTELGGGHHVAVLQQGQADEVARIIDSAERIINSQIPPVPAPIWRGPLPLEPDPTAPVASEYEVGAITSARVKHDGQDMAEEAELHLSGYEIAHAGVFADGPQFRRNISDARVCDGRFEWLLPLLENAPPQMAKVGIGWERLLGSLLGGVEPGRFQLFPRSGTGTSSWSSA